MQQTQSDNQFQYITGNRQPGAAASRFGYQQPPPTRQKGLLAQIREAIWNMITEESDDERPIGISQLTRNTFQASDNTAGQSFYRNTRGVQDYRFNHLTESQR